MLRGARSGPSIHEVEGEPVSVRDRMIAVMERLGHVETLEFEQVFEAEGERASRPLLVATFLAILELVRLAALRVYQGLDEAGVPCGPIRLRRADGDSIDAWAGRIAEIM